MDFSKSSCEILFFTFHLSFFTYMLCLCGARGKEFPQRRVPFISYSLFITAKRDTFYVSRFSMLNKTLFSSTILLLGNIQQALILLSLNRIVGLPGFEPRLREPKPLVLPLHHSPIQNQTLFTFAGAKVRKKNEL